MKNKSKEKDKAIILNEDNQILVFIQEDKDHKQGKLFYPSITDNSQIELLKSSNLSEYVFLTSYIVDKSKFDCVNGKLVKVEEKEKTNYYVTYHPLKEEEIAYFVNFGNWKHAKPYFASLDEIKQYIYDWSDSYGTVTYKMGSKLIPVTLLEGKWKKPRIRRLGREDKNVRH